MGYLTPVLIRNDAINIIAQNADDVVKGIIAKAASGNDGSVGTHGHVNVVEVLHPLHNQLSRLLMVTGNTIIDLNASKTTLELAARSKHTRNFVLECIDDALTELEHLQRAIKEIPVPGE